MHREAVTYIDKAPKGVLKYHDFEIYFTIYFGQMKK